MKIIKKPNIPAQKCDRCKCEFEIKPKNLKFMNAEIFVSKLIVFVKCPVCKNKVEVKFETPQNETL